MLNRETRRCVDKAVRCLDGGTKIPGQVAAKLALHPSLVDHLETRAAQRKAAGADGAAPDLVTADQISHGHVGLIA